MTVGEWIHTGLFLAAMTAIAYGCHLAWPPLGYIVPGAIVLAGTCLTFAAQRGRKE